MLRMGKATAGSTAVDPAAVEGDFRSFYAAERPRLVRALYLLTGSLADAEDVAQEAMVRIFERWEHVRGMDSATGYLYRTALNLNHRRVRRLLLGAQRLGASLDDSPDPAIRAEARGDVRRALRALSRGHREVLVLHEWLELDAAEVGRALGIAPGSARSRLHRARASFRAHLGEGYE
jgi:RNA polymerase sigma-70 factor, ECF subfamily